MKPPKSRPTTPPPRPTVPILREVFLFRDWSESDLRAIMPITQVRRFRTNKIIFERGTACARLFVVLRGRIQLSRLAADGRETVLNVLKEGELLGWAALFLGHAYPASARVVSAGAELLSLDGGEFREILRRRPDLSFRVIAALAARLAIFAGHLESRATESARERVLAWLRAGVAQSPCGTPAKVVIRSTKKALAEELGMTPETLSRCLSALRDEGVIEINRREITLSGRPS